MEQVYDPVLRQRWKHLCRRLHHLARAAVVHVYQAKRLGVLSAKGYKNITDKDETTDDPKKKEKMPQRRAKASTAARPKTASSAAASSSTPAKAYHVKYQTECPYPTFKRHGNRHGSFATCTACMARWKWDGRGWKQHGSSSKLSLPLPSFLTTVDGSIKPPGYTGETFLQLPPPGSVPKGNGSHDDCRTDAASFDGPWNVDGNYGGRFHEQDWFTKVKATLDDLFSGRTHEASKPDAGLRCGIHRSGGTRFGGDGQHLQLAPGKRKRLVGEVKKATKALWPEVLVVNDIPSEKSKPHYVDVFELFAGSAKATLFAKKYGLNALEPYELADGKDLCDKKVDNAEFVGAFGAVDLDGFPIIKTYGFLLNCPKIARALDRSTLMTWCMQSFELYEKQRDPQLPVPGLRTDVTFPGAPKELASAVKASVARLRLNTGHANKKELIRFLSAHGSVNAATLTAIEHMVCGSCQRTRKPDAPRPASVPHFLGQYGERVQLDIVYVRDLTGSNHMILGMVDLATSFQQAVRVQSRNAEHVLEMFLRAWLAPYGYPLVCEVDADGAFEGEFRLQLEHAGVHVPVIPPEAHWKIGTVERRNAILRTTLEKLIDENAVVNGAGLDWILVAAVQALNASTASKGRCPYQAVFGRLPRFPGDLFSDDRALAVTDSHLLAEELRCQALRVINEMRASQTIRRALLRKTKPGREECKQILPGSLAAYWRWSKKVGGRKRGGYVLGRLVSHDDDGKSAWLHAGQSIAQVTYEQLRPAYRLSPWCDAPSAQAEATPMALEGQPAAEDVPIPGSSSGPTTMSQSNIVDHFTFIVQELPHEGCEMERKALDREIPWRVIVAGPKEIFDLYVAANIKEYESWLSWACIRPLSEERIHEIKNTPSLKRRIIPARNAYRDKNRSPRDAIQQAAKSFPCELYEIVGNLYGFASAPRTWWLNVLTTCLQKNFIQHRYDKCLLIKRDAKGLLQVVMIVHVDDFLVTFRSDYDVEELRQMFTWGSTTLLDEKNEIIFRGKEIRVVKTNGKITLKVTQRAFIEEMSCGTLARGRLSAESLNESEWRELRSVAGSLQWLGGQTRPDLCSAVSLANKGRDTKPSDLKTLFEYIQLAKETADLGLAFFPSPFNKASLIIGYGDSSWANGQTPLVAKAKWANAMDETVDRATYANVFVSELLYGGTGKTPRRGDLFQLRALRQAQCTDCKSLYDAVISPNVSTSEKRTMIAIRSAQDFIKEDECHWVPTEVMWADVLTKEDRNLCLAFQ
ncbi:Copia protein (Gag-int-pol protein) [Cleaved into: Copia VLP protein, partial [Durusdinium trenchii]